MIYLAGDSARYIGDAIRPNGVFLMTGDLVTVLTGNLDDEDDVKISNANGEILVSPGDLEWINGA